MSYDLVSDQNDLLDFVSTWVMVSIGLVYSKFDLN